MIRHLLLLKLRDDTSESQIEKISQGFSSLTETIPGVLSVEWGKNDSPEGKNKGYNYLVLLTFEGEECRQLYLDHPAHSEVKPLFRPYLEEIIVFDYQV